MTFRLLHTNTICQLETNLLNLCLLSTTNNALFIFLGVGQKITRFYKRSWATIVLTHPENAFLGATDDVTTRGHVHYF